MSFINLKLFYIIFNLFLGHLNLIPDSELTINSLNKYLELSEQKIEIQKKNAIENEANELGQVMVIMYHNLVDDASKEGAYARSYENLKKDLITMYNEGYIPITMKEYISGKINVPIGKTPIILTFDDGHKTDIIFDENGDLSKNCVVGIFEEVNKIYPDFKPKATFYINSNPWGDSPYDEKKLEYMLKNGHQIGNHTRNHKNLKRIPLEDAKEQIILQQEFIETLTGEKEFDFALPFGEKPQDYLELVKSDWLKPYKMRSSVNVGWNPINSIYNIEFNPHNINRITCGEDASEFYYWLEYFKKNPKKRFISDGVSDMITIKKEDKNKLNKNYFNNFLINEY